jgi:hypothetical protein
MEWDVLPLYLLALVPLLDRFLYRAVGAAGDIIDPAPMVSRHCTTFDGKPRQLEDYQSSSGADGSNLNQARDCF